MQGWEMPISSEWACQAESNRSPACKYRLPNSKQTKVSEKEKEKKKICAGQGYNREWVVEETRSWLIPAQTDASKLGPVGREVERF